MATKICPKCQAPMSPLKLNIALPEVLGDVERAQANVNTALPVRGDGCTKCGYLELYSLLQIKA